MSIIERKNFMDIADVPLLDRIEADIQSETRPFLDELRRRLYRLRVLEACAFVEKCEKEVKCQTKES